MSSLNLASAGESLVIWKLPQKDRLHEVTHFDTVTGASWAYDGSCLATFGERKRDHVTLTYMKNDACSSAEILGPGGHQSIIQSIQFPKTTSKLLYVAVNDKVCLFDINRKKSKLEFKNVSKVSCMGVNVTDRWVAAGTTKGYLHVLSTKTGQSAFARPIVVSTEKAMVTSVQFNAVKYSMIGTSTDAGAVCFWDVNLAKEIHSFAEHNAPATDLAFSPVNEVLVLSSGKYKNVMILTCTFLYVI